MTVPLIERNRKRANYMRNKARAELDYGVRQGILGHPGYEYFWVRDGSTTISPSNRYDCRSDKPWRALAETGWKLDIRPIRSRSVNADAS